MMMRLRTEKALPLLACAMAVLMVLVAAVPFWLNRSMGSVLHGLHGDLAVQQSMVDVLGELRDAQSAQRGFIVTGNEAFLQPYFAAGQRLPPLLREGREHASSEAQHAVLRRIEQLVGLELADLDETIALRRTDTTAAVARGQPYMEELRRLVGEETARGQRQRERQRDALLALSERACLLGAGAAVLGIAMLAGLTLLALYALRERQEGLRALEARTHALAGTVEHSDAHNRELRLTAEMLRAVAAAPAVPDTGPAISRCFAALLPGRAGAVFLAPEDGEAPVREHVAQWAAEQLAPALCHARERESLRRQATQDPLTGLFNRRYFDEAVNRELSRARRKALPTSLVVLDIDHFKRVNDTYGHGTGDNVLCAIARQIGTAIREGDIACRYGGEELVILMPECPAGVAAERAEELRAAIETCGSQAGEPGRITASFGVAECPTHGSDAESLFLAADRAMYRAKHQGRNQVVAAGA